MTGSTLAVVRRQGHSRSPGGLPRPGPFAKVFGLESHANVTSAGMAGFDQAITSAEESGAAWMIELAPGEQLAEDALELAAPALDLFDAIFGAAHVEGSSEPVARLTRLAFDRPERLPHGLLNWRVPRAHLVRPAVARRALQSVPVAARDHSRLPYLFALWESARCMKSAQPLLRLAEEPAPLQREEREWILRRLDKAPAFIPVVHGGTTYHLPYTGRNIGIEREQTRGLFFEAEELEVLRGMLKPGCTVVDVGANTGNHTVFFAGPGQAAKVTPIEPMPSAAAALRAAVARNGLRNVDLTKLGIGVADREGRAALLLSEGGGLGATALRTDPLGSIVVVPLDSVITGPIDLLKIDVEGMEMSVLAGAASLIARHRPIIFMEVANRNVVPFTAWVGKAGYAFKRIFTDKGHANYLIAPRDPP